MVAILLGWHHLTHHPWRFSAGVLSTMAVESLLLAVCLRMGYRLDWVPIQTIYQGEKSHIQPGQHVWNFLRVAWKVRQDGKNKRN